jgi:hypothetical protein
VPNGKYLRTAVFWDLLEFKVHDVEGLKVKAAHFYETSRTSCPARHRHIQEKFNIPLHL